MTTVKEFTRKDLPPQTHAYDDPTLSSLEFLQAVYRDTTLPMHTRIDAARGLLPPLPPDIAEKQAASPPAKIENDTHHPGGELHSVSPKEDPEDPDLEIEDGQGTLPNELQKDVPPPPSTYPSFDLPKPPVEEQPVAVNQE